MSDQYTLPQPKNNPIRAGSDTEADYLERLLSSGNPLDQYLLPPSADAADQSDPTDWSTNAECYRTPIERLNLAPRTMNCLKRAGICYINDFLEMSDTEILQIPGFNRSSLKPLRCSFEEWQESLPGFHQGEMNLSARLLNCMRQACIWYPDNLFCKSDAELLSILGIGEKLSAEIHQAQETSGWTGTSIDELKLSTRTRDALKAAGNTLCERLWNTTDAKLLLIPGIEKKNVEEVRVALKRLSNLWLFGTEEPFSGEEREKALPGFHQGEMNLSARLLNCLRQARIWYPDDLFYKSDGLCCMKTKQFVLL